MARAAVRPPAPSYPALRPRAARFRAPSLLQLLCTAITFCLLAAPAWAAPRIAIANHTVTLRNEHYRYVFDTSAGLDLTELWTRQANTNVITDPTDQRFGVITFNARHVALSDMTVQSVEQIADGVVRFVLIHDQLRIDITATCDDSPEVIWLLTATNLTDQTAEIRVSFPIIGGLTFSDDLEAHEYYHGVYGGAYGRDFIDLSDGRGTTFPVIDVFDKRVGGLYMISPDPQQRLRVYQVLKKQAGADPKPFGFFFPNRQLFSFDRGCGLAITYMEESLAPSQSYATPNTIVGVHPGRWEQAWTSYANWLRSIAPGRPTPRWFREHFISKALHEGHYHPGTTYDFTPTIQPFDRFTLFNLNHWMDTRGDYHIRSDWGGPDPLKTELTQLRDQGIRSCLYIEAVQAWDQSQVGREHPDWAVLMGGEVQTNPNGDDVEYEMCAASPWRDHVASVCRRLFTQTNCDAIYLDSVGIRMYECEQPSHFHRPRRDWYESVRKLYIAVAEQVDAVHPDAVFYSESYGSGLNSRYTNGAYGYFLHEMKDLRAQGFDFPRAGTNLLRFYFPQYKFTEIIGDERDEIAWALFNGNAVHSYFHTEAIFPFLNECVRIWEQNLAAWTSDSPQPLLETGRHDLYMNAFPDGDKIIYTLWNGADEDLMNVPVTLTADADRHYVDLFHHHDIAADTSAISVDVPLGEVAIIAALPRSLKVCEDASGELAVTATAQLPEPSIRVFIAVQRGDEAPQWESHTLPWPQANDSPTLRLNPTDLAPSGSIQHLAIQLLDGHRLVDECIVR
jgi:hypothetical protein